MNTIWPGTETLATIASIVSAFAIAMLVFRIQRELAMQTNKEILWIPWADRLLIASGTVALLLVVLPLLLIDPTNEFVKSVPPAACATSIVLVSGYPFSIVAHYRLILGGGKNGPRINPEPAKRWIVIATVVVSLIFFIIALAEREV